MRLAWLLVVLGGLGVALAQNTPGPVADSNYFYTYTLTYLAGNSTYTTGHGGAWVPSTVVASPTYIWGTTTGVCTLGNTTTGEPYVYSACNLDPSYSNSSAWPIGVLDSYAYSVFTGTSNTSLDSYVVAFTLAGNGTDLDIVIASTASTTGITVPALNRRAPMQYAWFNGSAHVVWYPVVEASGDFYKATVIRGHDLTNGTTHLNHTLTTALYTPFYGTNNYFKLEKTEGSRLAYTTFNTTTNGTSFCVLLLNQTWGNWATEYCVDHVTGTRDLVILGWSTQTSLTVARVHISTSLIHLYTYRVTEYGVSLRNTYVSSHLVPPDYVDHEAPYVYAGDVHPEGPVAVVMGKNGFSLIALDPSATYSPQPGTETFTLYNASGISGLSALEVTNKWWQSHIYPGATLKGLAIDLEDYTLFYELTATQAYQGNENSDEGWSLWGPIGFASVFIAVPLGFLNACRDTTKQFARI